MVRPQLLLIGIRKPEHKLGLDDLMGGPCRACGSSIMEWPIYFLAYLLPEFSFTAVRDMDGRKPVGLGYCRLV